MPVRLQGGCLVTGLRDGEPERRGVLGVRRPIGRHTGTRAISLRAIEIAPGLSPGFRNAACEEVFYVMEGRATIFLDGWAHEVSEEAGIYLPPGSSFAAENPGPGPLVLISSRCPEPDSEPRLTRAITRPVASGPRPGRPPIVRLSDRTARAAGDRWYKVLVDHRAGCRQVTQFVGSIPPGRAPDHYHQYEEVLSVLRGRGVLWAGQSSAPVGPGSCIYLPSGQVHCVQNTGAGELRLLGVFHPAGSPAVRYEAD